MHWNTNLLLITLVLLITAFSLVNVQTAVASQAIPAPTMYASYHRGDPYTTVYYHSEILPPNGTASQIKITAPINGTILISNNTVLSFDLTLKALSGSQSLILRELCYKLSWQLANTTVKIGAQNPTVSQTLPFAVNLTGVPEGNQSITIYAQAITEFEVERRDSASGQPKRISRWQIPKHLLQLLSDRRLINHQLRGKYSDAHT